MSSSSGDDSRSGKSPAPNKVKSILPSIRAPDLSYTPVISKKNVRKSKANSLSPKSPEFQQILNNTPMLNTSAFDYDNLLSTKKVRRMTRPLTTAYLLIILMILHRAPDPVRLQRQLLILRIPLITKMILLCRLNLHNRPSLLIITVPS
jgi:hypothetical protein